MLFVTANAKFFRVANSAVVVDIYPVAFCYLTVYFSGGALLSY